MAIQPKRYGLLPPQQWESLTLPTDPESADLESGESIVNKLC